MDLGAYVREPQDGRITFSFGVAPRKVSGLGQLRQAVIIEIMSDPRPAIGRGSGFVSILRASGNDDQAVVASQAARALDTAKNHIFQFQGSDPTLLDSERLLDLRLRRLHLAQTQWWAEIEMKSMTGERFVIPAG